MAYSFTVSYLILFLMNLIPGLKIRVDEKTEMEGLDRALMGEYTFEALSEKEAKWSLNDFLGEAEENEHGGITSV
jgi:ammonium transporter, Amt family